MPTNKKTALKSKTSVNAGKRRLVIILAAFAAVGAALLIRSFASTIVLSANYATSFSGKDPNLSVVSKGATPAQVVAEPDGKKTVNYLDTGQDGLSYSFKLAPGFYKACIIAKPVTVGAKAEVRSVLVGSTTAEPITVSVAEDGGKTYALNTFKETCVTAISRDANQALAAMFIPTSGNWRLSSLTVKTLDQSTEEFDLQTTFKSKDPRFTFSGASVYYDAARGKNVLKLAQGGYFNMQVTSFDRQLVNFQVRSRADTANTVMTLGAGRNQKGGSEDISVSNPQGNDFNTLSTSAYRLQGLGGVLDTAGVSTADPMQLRVAATTGALYVDTFYLFTANYGSN